MTACSPRPTASRGWVYRLLGPVAGTLGKQFMDRAGASGVAPKRGPSQRHRAVRGPSPTSHRSAFMSRANRPWDGRSYRASPPRRGRRAGGPGIAIVPRHRRWPQQRLDPGHGDSPSVVRVPRGPAAGNMTAPRTLSPSPTLVIPTSGITGRTFGTGQQRDSLLSCLSRDNLVHREPPRRPCCAANHHRPARSRHRRHTRPRPQLQRAP